MSDEIIRELRQLRWATIFDTFFITAPSTYDPAGRMSIAKQKTHDFMSWMDDKAAEQRQLDKLADRSRAATAQLEVAEKLGSMKITHTIVDPGSPSLTVENIIDAVEQLGVECETLGRVVELIRRHERGARDMTRGELLSADARAYRDIARVLRVPTNVASEDEAT